MTTTARYSGTCSDCGDRYAAGEEIRSTRRGWAHAECNDSPTVDREVLHEGIAALKRELEAKNPALAERDTDGAA